MVLAPTTGATEMIHKTVYAKCPYCKSVFKWIQVLIGEYAPSESEETCWNCGRPCKIKVENIMKFSAKKM